MLMIEKVLQMMKPFRTEIGMKSRLAGVFLFV